MLYYLTMIEPVILKGFKDSLPKEEIAKKNIQRTLEDVFSSYGFVPIDTPVLEYENILLGKGGGETDKQIFHFEDNGKRKVAMRFDLTVPFARFLALHFNELAIPFKRYHIAKAFRGENPQKGRYREFIQCDFDIVGADNASSDFEILSLMNSSFSALGIKGYTFCLAHRGLFNEFLSSLMLSDKAADILRAVDKMRKIGKEKVKQELEEITGRKDKTDKIISYISANENRSFTQTLDYISSLIGEKTESYERMMSIYSLLDKAGIKEHFVYDPSITRGLDYYTGIVYETFLSEIESIGSVCSGGRYNNLVSLYSKENLPGVGASIGLDRLVAALSEIGSPLVSNTRSADIVIFPKPGEEEKAQIAAAELRALGLRTDVYLRPEKKMKAQFEYAEKNSIPYALTFTSEAYALKNLATRESKVTLSLREVKELCQ